MLQLLGIKFPDPPPTGALPMDSNGGLPSAKPPTFDSQQTFIRHSTDVNANVF